MCELDDGEFFFFFLVFFCGLVFEKNFNGQREREDGANSARFFFEEWRDLQSDLGGARSDLRLDSRLPLVCRLEAGGL